jgi:leucyl aminopeptidase
LVAIKSGRSFDKGSGPLLAVPLLTGLTPGPGAAWAMSALRPWLDDHLRALKFEGKSGQTALVPTAGALSYKAVLFVGLGEEADLEVIRSASAAMRRALPKVDRVATTLHLVDVEGAAGAVVEGFRLAGYRFDRHRSEVAGGEPDLILCTPVAKPEVERAQVVADAVGLARDWGNEPAGGKGPADLAGAMGEAAASAGLGFEVWESERLRREGMEAILGVGAGSYRPPCLFRAEYSPPEPLGHVVLVGKGIVFDSGGLSIKPAVDMETMKTDMCGAAAVVAASIACARLQLPVKVTALAPLAENLPGGGALKPGDVVRARNGKTIEVLNTDAEGRLVLADALSFAIEAEPDLVVDVATLTGAAKIALGLKIAGLFGNDESAISRVESAARAAGERVWRMPLPADHRAGIDSDIADMKNIGGRFGGAITAALLLEEFVGDTPWAHLDVAGPARAEKDEGYVTKGATGFGVRTLIELVSGWE